MTITSTQYADSSAKERVMHPDTEQPVSGARPVAARMAGKSSAGSWPTVV
jgi:hypothetical protein